MVSRNDISSRKKITGLVIVAILIGVPGCLDLGGPSGEDLANRMKEETSTIESFEAQMVIKEGNRTLFVDSISKPQYGLMRNEYVRPQSVKGKLVIINQSSIWVYQPSTETAKKYSKDRGVTKSVQKPFENILKKYEVSYGGTAKIEGQDVQVLHIRGKDDSSATESGTFWINTETGLPVKQEIKLRYSDREIVTIYKQFNVGISNSTFNFEPPANVEVIDMGYRGNKTK